MNFLRKFLLISFLFAVTNLIWAKSNDDIDFLRKKAKEGDLQAQLAIGNEFFYGINRARNLALSFYYFNMAAQSGSLEAMYNLGCCYEFGYGVKASKNLAYQNYEQAAQKVDAAKFKVALFLLEGIKGEKIGVVYHRAIPKNLPTAKKLIDELIEKEFAPALTLKAQEILSANSSDETSQLVAFDLLSKAEAKGDLQAKKYLIDCYLKGIGCKINEKKAVELIYQVLDKGDKSVLAKLALCYELGIGVAPDMEQAVNLYLEASELGDGFARIKIADQYLSGFYLNSDMVKAIKIYNDELAKNNRLALLRLANCFEYGIGVNTDEQQSFLLYLKAASQGEVEAQYNLARLFREGKGTITDEGAVVFWLKEGVKSNNINCMRELAVCYLQGYGVPQNIELAKKLLVQAAQRGDFEAENILNRDFE